MSGSMPVRAAVLWERVGLVTSPEEEFAEFAAAPAPRLRRAAFLRCGDWHTAEDLAQTALAKVFVSWRKVRRQDAAHAYARRRLRGKPLPS
jgi:DNA-directed RNA polymerase specialized sigma24 family protein